MHLSYLPDPPPGLSQEDQEVYERIKARRAADNLPLLGIDLTLLHAPKVANGWNALLGAIRTQTSLADNIREIAICRAALLNEAWTEWNPHEALLSKVPGFTQDKMAVVRTMTPTSPGPLDEREWAVLRYADAMTSDVHVKSEVLQGLKVVGFNEQEIVEITATVAAYNLTSRFVVALDVMEGRPPAWFTKSRT